MSKITVNESRCTGCGQCVKICPAACIEMRDSQTARTTTKGKVPFPKLAVIDEGKCILCRACVQACAKLGQDAVDKNLFSAIEIPETAVASDLSAYTGVWCFAEVLHGTLAPNAYELLHIGRQLADKLGQKVCAVVMAHNASSFCKTLAEHGADTVYCCEDPSLENFIDDVFAKALTDLVLKYKPNKFLLPATTIGRSVAAKIAILANTGLTADATGVVIDSETGLMQVTRPTFGGNLMATIVCKNSRPEMCTIRPLTYPKAAADASRKTEIINFTIDPARHNSKAKFSGFVREESNEIDITAAEVIVSGGRGVKSQEGFELLKKLAHALNGAVGASRAAVDSGWIAYRHQVGLTGRTVKPKIYIACGISGQVQHLAGMSSSDIIIAINKDPEAPIMKQATYAIEGDIFEVIPAMLEQLKN